MDHLILELESVRHGTYKATAVAILVNGRRLEALARDVELSHAVDEGSPNLAGDYSPLSLDDIRGDRMHFLGRPVTTWFDDGDTVLMGCPCGEWGCWPLTVRVEVGATSVEWSGFRNGHRDWDLTDLGPFVFDRAQYDNALAVIPEQGLVDG